MTVLGITGRAGSGKSFAIDLIKTHYSFERIDLDEIGHLLLCEPSCKQEIQAAFGEEVLGENGEINRSQLGKIVFASDSDLAILNSIVHPKMKSYVEALLAEKKGTLLIIVGALIQEIELSSYCDHLICIDATDEAIQQYAGDKQYHIATNCQRSRSAYQTACDHVIVNAFDGAFKQSLLTLLKVIVKDPKN
tara:strand:+ start:379 stop:954 length:576 start_codon:yes stop_codon:yes gene_type:complete